MRRYFRMPAFFLLYSHPSKTKMAHPTFIKRSSDEYKTYALYPSDDIIKRKQYEIVLDQKKDSQASFALFFPKTSHIFQSLSFCFRNHLPYKQSCKHTNHAIKPIGKHRTEFIHGRKSGRDQIIEYPLESYSDTPLPCRG